MKVETSAFEYKYFLKPELFSRSYLDGAEAGLQEPRGSELAQEAQGDSMLKNETQKSFDEEYPNDTLVW